VNSAKNISISENWLVRIAWLYLLIPFLVFCLGFLRIYISLPMLALFGWLSIRLWKSDQSSEKLVRPRSDWLFLGLIILVWVFFSGVGGDAFQNTDFNGRNAIFRDLINYSWPVYYTNLGSSVMPAHTFSFVYYFGFWLAPALIGKLLGWTAANIALFLYTVLGVGITVSLLAKRMKTSLLASILLLMFFSGMDILGALLKQYASPGIYPTLWPPISHLEWWQTYQISSFTTQLFWVVNQAVPAWICTLLVLTRKDNHLIFLVWSLCFFFAPIPALGLAMLVFAQVLNDLIRPIKNEPQRPFWRVLFARLQGLLSLENILGGGLVTALMYFFYQSNRSTGKIGLIPLDGMAIISLILFALIEWFVLWLAVAKNRQKDISWYFMGVLLAVAPMIDLAGTPIISERATIPFMLLLMVWCGETLFHERSKASVLVALLLVIGACTPIYEMSRSGVRTAEFYQLPPVQQKVAGQCYVKQVDRIAFYDPEKDHPGELVAEDWYSLASLNLEYLVSYVGDTSSAIFFKYLSR